MTEKTKEGTRAGVILSMVMLVGSLLGCVISGIAAGNMSESEAVQISYFTVPIIVAGLVAWVPALLARKQSAAIAVGAPLGCGCLSGIFAGIGLAIFYVVLWPSL